MLAIAPRDLALLVFICLIWGFNLIVSKYGVGEFPPLFFTTLRFGLVALLLIPFLRVVRGQMGAIFVAALFSGAAHFSTLFAGLAIADNVSSVAIAGQLGVPFTTLMSIAFLGEVVRWRRWLGIALAFGGVMLIGLDPAIFQFWEGLGLVVLSAFTGSLGLMAVKKLTGWNPLELQAWVAIISFPIIGLVSYFLESGHAEAVASASFNGWLALVFTVLMASIVAHTGYYYLVHKYPVTSVSPLTVLSPVFGVYFGVTLFGDDLGPRLATGAVMTLTGVFIVALRERKIIETGT